MINNKDCSHFSNIKKYCALKYYYIPITIPMSLKCV